MEKNRSLKTESSTLGTILEVENNCLPWIWRNFFVSGFLSWQMTLQDPFKPQIQARKITNELFNCGTLHLNKTHEHKSKCIKFMCSRGCQVKKVTCRQLVINELCTFLATESLISIKQLKMLDSEGFYYRVGYKQTLDANINFLRYGIGGGCW